MNCDCVHAGIQEFSSGGGGGPGPDLFLFFFSPQLILQKSKKTTIFQGCREGPTGFVVVPTFSGGGGVHLLIPYSKPYNL